MADVVDIESALVALAASAVYPDGVSAAPVASGGVRVYPGWPVQQGLDEDLRAGLAHISVFTRPGMAAQRTRYLPVPRKIAQATATLTAAVTGSTVAFGGSATAGELVGIEMEGVGYTYAELATDTAASVALAFAGAIDGAWTTGNILNCPAAPSSVQVAGVITTQTERRRQLQHFQVSVWSGDPEVRASLAQAVDEGIAASDWITLPDQVSQILYVGTHQDDSASNAGIFRRDLFYSVEYGTTLIQTAPQMLFGIGMTQVRTVKGGVLQPFGQTAPSIGFATDAAGNLYEDAAGNLVAQVQQPYAGLMVNSSGYVQEDSAGNLAGDPA